MALRTLARRPLFSIAVVCTLAAGLGANATIFSVIDSVLLRALPYEEPDGLVAVWSTVQRDPGRPDTVERRGFSIPDLLAVREQATTLQGVAAYSDASFRLEGDTPERLTGTLADSHYLSTLGVLPVLGRDLSDEPLGEGGVPGILLSHGLWQRLFGGNPGVLGRVLQLNGEPAEVVGVLPAGFRGLVDGSELLVPLRSVGARPWESRGARWLNVVARRSPFSTDIEAQSNRSETAAGISAIQDELAALFQRLEQQHPESNRGYSAAVQPLSEDLVGDLRSPLFILWAAVAAVLLIATVNVINLLIVHLGQRAGDFALSRALGASTTRLLRQVASEALVLAAAAGLLGVGFALVALRLLQPISPIDLPGLYSVEVGGRALLFALALAAVLGLAVGLITAARTLRPLARRRSDVAPQRIALDDPRTTRRDALRSGLLVGEVALATLLTIGAGLLVRSFWSLSEVDPGMARSGVGFLRLDLGDSVRAEELPSTRAEILEQVRATPGVEHAALATDSPFDDRAAATLVSTEGTLSSEALPYNGATRIYRHMVSPGYFATLGIPLLRGRDLAPSDALPVDDESTGPDAPGVAVVSGAFASKAWPGEDAIGKRFYLGPPVGDPEQARRRPWLEVVGVAADHRHRSLVPNPDDPADPDVFFAMEQFNPSDLTLVVSSRLPIEPLLRQLSSKLQAQRPELIAFAAQTLEARLAEQTARARFSGLLMTSFSVLSLVLAGIGIYGVVAYTVLQRRREIGLRMALGADRARVVREVGLPALGLVAAGLAIGAGIAVFASRALRSQLFEIRNVDPGTYLFGLALLLLVGTAAAAIPATRASRVDPMEALRSD